MLANFGYGALLISLLVSIYGIFAAIYGVRTNKPAWVESARLAMLLTFPLITASALSLILLLVNGSYELEYVSSVTSNSMPLYLRITALWGGQAGSLIFWSITRNHELRKGRQRRQHPCLHQGIETVDARVAVVPG